MMQRDQSDEGEREAVLAARIDDLRESFRTNFDEYAASCLCIRTKSGAVAPFILNRTQLYVHQRIEAQRKERGYVRAIILKARQPGISTYVAGRYYWRATHGMGLRAFIMAHLDVASDNLFDIAKRYHDNCPVAFRPQTGAANAKELSFPGLDSGYKVATAGSKDVGRSETIQLFHGSEAARWANASLHFAGIIQAVAKADGTECILESTADGIGNPFHQLWQAAERGDSEFEAIFIAWFLHEEYRASPPEGWQPPAKFAEYGELYGLDEEQVYWAWEKNRTLAQASGGTVDEPCWLFKQEYPANPQEAFESSGDESFVRAPAVMRARKTTGIRPHGPIIIGVDPARGGRDKTGIIDRQGRVMGARICKRYDYGDDTMPIAGEIVRLYRDLRADGEIVYVAIDTGGLGGPLYDRLRELLPPSHCYPVVYGGNAWDEDRYLNKRAEIWDAMRQWFEDPAGVSCPDRDDLQGDICAPIRGKGATRYDSAGRLQLESKEHIEERIKASPDLGDAAANTFAIDMGLIMDRDDDDEDDDHGQAYATYTRSSITGY